MKPICTRFTLAALLLATIAVPLVGHTPKTTNLPKAVADSLPIPWPKKPAVAREMPKMMADSLPIPWPKKPGFARS